VRILFVSQMYPGPDDPDHGAFLVPLVEALRRRGHELELAVLTSRAGGRRKYVTLARRARAAGATVLFDPNWRPALWRSPEDAAAAQEPVLEHVDWLLCGQEEGRLLFGGESAKDVVDAARAGGCGDAVVRVGARGALVGGELVPPRRLTDVVDEIGAGDGFAAGFAWGLLHGLDPRACASCGNVIAARALAGTGDWETLPRLEEVADELVSGSDVAHG